MKKLIEFIIALALLTIAIFAGGFLFMKTWNWHAVYALSVASLTYTKAVSLYFFSVVVFFRLKDHSEKTISELVEQTFDRIVLMLLILTISYLLTFIH